MLYTYFSLQDSKFTDGCPKVIIHTVSPELTIAFSLNNFQVDLTVYAMLHLSDTAGFSGINSSTSNYI